MAWGQQRRGVDDLVAKLRGNETGPALLVMSTRKVDEAGLRALAEALAGNTSLEELLCSGHSVSKDAARQLAEALRKNRRLKRLSVGCAKFGDAELAALLEAWDNPTLEALDLEFKALTAAGMPHLGGVLAHPAHALQDIRLGRNALGDEGVAALAHGLRQGPRFLRNLELNSSGLGVDGCRALGDALRGSPASQGALRLVLSDNPAIGDAGVQALVDDAASQDASSSSSSQNGHSSTDASTAATSVRELHLDDCGIGPEGFASLCASTRRSGSRFHALRVLSVGRNAVTRIEAEAAAACASQLEDLDLRANKVGLEGLRALGDALAEAAAAARLQRLNVTSIGVDILDPAGEEGVEAFGATVRSALQADSLKELRLMGNSLGDEGAAAVVDALRQNTSLETLALGAVGLSRAGAEALKAPLQENSGLRTLELGGNDLGDGKALVDEFRAARADLVVALDGQQQP